MMKLDLKKKLLLQFVCSGIVPLIIMGSLAYKLSNDFLEEAAFDRLRSIQELKLSSVKRYFTDIKHQITSFSHDIMIQEAAADFRESFFSIIEEQQIDDASIESMKTSLLQYYNGPFGEEYQSQNGEKPDVNSLVSQMDDLSILWQYRYIQDNEHPLGSKHELYKASDNSLYSEHHDKNHPYIKEYLENFGYYDIFILDSKTGHIIYSVFKELDYATSLITGPYSNTNFAEVFKEAAQTKDQNFVSLIDFKQYTPSYEAPASFIAAPIFHKGENIAVVVFQMPIDGINSIMGERGGLGETGESFIVGPDNLMRSDSFLDPDHRSVVSSFRNSETGKIETLDVNDAISGESGERVTQNYLGSRVLTRFAPLDLLGLRWAFIAQQSTKEAFYSAELLGQYMLLIALFSVIITISFGLFVGKGIANPILHIAKELGDGSEKVSEAARSMSQSSQQLSDLATEQGAAIEETAASVEEISAMVKNNLQQAQDSSDLSAHVKNMANKGNISMTDLVKSMDEITESNNKIQDLVSIIGEIGEKTEVIDEIVFQTKLLSFNASVEAERAGEHGRGFAVVAQEVGNLAQMSGKAALEISSMVKQSIRDTESITSESKKKVEQGNILVKDTAKYLESIASDAELLSEQAARIVTASREQSDGVSQVNEAMNQLDQATQQNSATAENSATVADGLEDQSTTLLSNVEQLMEIIYNKPVSHDEIALQAEERKPKDPKKSKKSTEKNNSIQSIGQTYGATSHNDDDWDNI
ncbi:MAG: methyl-accepting chemotaxis protein [Oligoflexales bacterium]